MPLDLQNPGVAAANALDTYLAQQHAQKRQDMMDQLAIQREADTHAIAMEALQDKHDKARLDMKEKERTDTVKDVGNMAIGDIPDADLIGRAKKHGVPLPMSTTPQMTTPVPAQPVPGIIPSMGAPTPPPVATPMPMRFGGTRPEQEKEQLNKSRADFAAANPSSAMSELALAQNAGITGGSAIINKENAATGGGEAIARQNLRSGVVERMVNGAWVPVTDDVPKGTHFMTEPAPKDTSARDAAADARSDAVRTKVYNTAVTELDKRAKPFEDQQVALNNLGVSLAQKNNPKADALVAIELLKGTVAGGGVRLTQPEITSLLGGSRTKWDNLSLKLNAWGGDPNVDLVLTEGEKDDMRTLARALRTKAHDQLGKITKARHKLDSLDDPREIQKAATALQEELDAAEDEALPVATSPATASGPAVTHIWNPKTGSISAVGAK